MMDSNITIDLYFRVHMFILCKFKIYHIIKFLSIKYIFIISEINGLILYYIFPVIRRDIEKAIQTCFPDLSTTKIKWIAKKHIAYTIFHFNLMSIIPFLSINKFLAMFKQSQFDEIFVKGSNYLIIGSHFFSYILLTYIADILYKIEFELCGVFAFNKALQDKNYVLKIKDRFHCGYHTPVVVGSTIDNPLNPFNTLDELRKFIKQKKDVVFTFSDIRLDKYDSDITYQIGKGKFYANNSLKFYINSTKEYKVIPIYMIFEQGKFKIIKDAELMHDEAFEKYYNEVLPSQINKYPEQWELWFMAPLLMELN